MVLAADSAFFLTSPGVLRIAPLGSTEPTNTVAGSVFTDAWPAAWLFLGATENGSEFSYASTIEPIEVAELLDPVAYATTGRAGSFAFALASWCGTNYRRALNGGVAELTPVSGTGATALYKVEPVNPGDEVRVMIGWESLDKTTRLVCRQTIQGGEITTAFQKAPAKAVIPVQYNLEKPASAQPFSKWFAGANRG